MDEITKLKNNLQEQMRRQVRWQAPNQVLWGTIKEVDWDNKTCTVTGLIDDLDIHNVELGNGSIYTKPTIGTKCLVGLIGNKEVDVYLIDVENFDELEITDNTGFKVHLKEGEMTINGDSFSGIVKAPELKAQIDKNTAILEKIQQVFNSWTPVPEDGGSALKTLVTQFTAMQRADLSNIENKKIKHGDG